MSSRSRAPLQANDWGLILAGVLAAVVIGIWGASRSPLHAYDDAFITYRYADNLRHGWGLVYNPGEWVLGTTTPLFAFLLAGLGLVIPDLALLGHWVGVVAWIGAAWLALALLWQASRPRAAVMACLLIAVEPALLLSLGMETPLLVALMLGTAWAWLGRRRWLAIVLAAALLLVRQDAALWLLLLGLGVWVRERAVPWRAALGVVVLTGPWFAFAWWRYGSPLPNSALAKIGQNELMSIPDEGSFVTVLWQMAVDPLSAAGTPLGTVGGLLAASLVAGPLLAGLWVIARRDRTWWWLPAWLAGYCAIYAVLDVVAFPWYFVPPITVTMVIAAIGLGHLLGDRREQAAGRRAARSGVVARWGVPALSALFLLALLAGRGQHTAASIDDITYRPDYVPAGEWLAANTPPDATVASMEIGMLGFRSRRPILDTMGLVSPDMTRHQVGWLESLTYALDVHCPDYAVALDKSGWDVVADSWWFQSLYTPAASLDTLTIYVRGADLDQMVELPLHVEHPDGFTLTGARVAVRAITLDVWLEIEAHRLELPPYEFTLTLRDVETGEPVAQVAAEPFDGLYRSGRWQVGDCLALPFRLELPRDLPEGSYQLGVQMYDLWSERQLVLGGEPGAELIEIPVGSLYFSATVEE